MNLLDKIKSALGVDFDTKQDKAFAEAKDNPTSDHELLVALGEGDLIVFNEGVK